MSDRRRRLWARLAGAALLALLLPTAPATAREPGAAELRAAAEAGDAAAMNELGGSLIATEDPARAAEAREWFRRAAAKGDVEAMSNYASLLEQGVGGPGDEAEGRRLMAEAAARGSVGAHLTIAERYLAGASGYPKDAARAFAHVETAAGIDSPMAEHAQWRLAMMHLQGVGTAKDSRAAYHILERASENGGVSAMISRAVMLATGDGVAEDDAAARHWYRRAAESGQVGFAHGLRGLGFMLLNGEGGPRDLPRGVAYLHIAQAGGDANAAAILGEWADRITPEIDRKAKQIANRWMSEHMKVD